jgi:hypothetical protein
MGNFPLIQIDFDRKIQIFEERVIVATTGSIGFSQRLHFHVDAAVKGRVFDNLDIRESSGNISKRLLTDFAGTNVMHHPQEGLRFGALLAAKVKDGHYLAEYATTDFQPEIKKDKLFFVSMGSGQVLADPFLAFVRRTLWKDQMPTVDEGKFGVYWVLDHTVRLAPGRVGPPIRLATLRQVGDKWIASQQDTQESAQYIAELEAWIGEFVRGPIDIADAVKIPAAPSPDETQKK